MKKQEVLIEVGILDEVERKLDIMEKLIPLIADLGWDYDLSLIHI